MTTLPALTPLTADQLREVDIPAPWAFGLKDQVRFGELDVLAHVNNASYLAWFENVRIHYFREYGVNDYAGSLPRIVLRTVGLEFLAEVKLHDVYVVTARTVSFRTTSWAMEYGVWTEAGLTTKGTAVLVNLNAQGQKEPLPDRWKDAFQKRDGALPA
ncbi:MAG: acyl-CoA thioesterase [Rhodobacteraceae bacterium]|nr:acyl-CoA thioesterase [Paracoccaceae bacterium]